MKPNLVKAFVVAAIFWASAAGPSAMASELTFDERCDIPGGSLSSYAEGDAKACHDACSKQASCRAFVHVSGWNRCFLKGDKAARKFPLRMVSGHVEKGKDGQRLIADQGKDRDYSGKDMRNLTGVKDDEACAKACLAEKGCAAYVYMEGYQSCWLKSSKGVARSKIFSCGLRTPPK